MAFTQKDKEILRKLATRYMEIAQLPVQKEKIALWKAINRGKMERPMVVIDQLPWNELNRTGELNCQIEDPTWRGVEQNLRETIYKWDHFPVDMVVDPFITIPQAISSTGIGISAHTTYLADDPNSTAKSKHFDNLIHDMEDVEKIQIPVITYDEKASELWMQEAADIFGGVAPILQGGVGNVHLGVWDTISQLMGVEDIYYGFIDTPELLHAAMERLTQAVISSVEQYNKFDIFNSNINTCHCSYIYTDELLPDAGAGKGHQSKDCWAFGLAQLFSSVSPALMEEFEMPYICRMAEYFGMIYYGCCDRLDDRLDWVKKIPHLKKVSCSPWSDRDNFAANIGPDLIMSNKPTPAFLAEETFRPDVIRDDLQHTYDAAKRNGVNLEYILKDISTVRDQPQRLTEWAEIAMRVVNQ